MSGVIVLQAGVGLLVSDVVPIYMIIPRYSHNYAQLCQLLNSNLFTHHRILMLSREATSETYGPGSILIISISYCLVIYFAIYFAFILLCIFIIKIPKLLSLSYLSDLTLVSGPIGIDNPICVGCEDLFVLCRYEGLVRGLLLD